MNCSDWLQLYWVRIPIYVEIRLVCPGSVTSSRAQVEVLMRTRAVCVTRFGELSWLGIQIRRFSAFTEFLKGWESVLGNACAGIQSYFGSSRRCIFMSRMFMSAKMFLHDFTSWVCHPSMAERKRHCTIGWQAGVPRRTWRKQTIVKLSLGLQPRAFCY